MRITTAECRPNAPLITPTHPRLALQRSADHLSCTLRLPLPVRRFRNLHRLWRHWHRLARRMRLGTAQRRSNAPGIAPARLSLAEKPSSYPRAILTPRRASLPIPLLQHIYIYQLLSRSHSRCMRISPTHSHPNAPLITSYPLALTSLRCADHLPRALRPCLLARSFRNLILLGRRQHCRTRRRRLGTA